MDDWIRSRAPEAPMALQERVRSIIGRELTSDVTLTYQVCLGGAARTLESILAARTFSRDGALDLLAVDALTTYAYERASEDAHQDLDEAALHGLQLLGRSVTSA